MPEPVTAIVLTMLGSKALELITAAAEDHTKDLVKRLFGRGEKILLGKKEREALEDSYRSALTSAYTRAIEALGKVLALTADQEEIERTGESVRKFLGNRRVADHLLETVRDLSNVSLPDPTVLEAEWEASGSAPLPLAGIWSLVAANFRKSAREEVFITPNLREVLNARNLDQIRRLGERLLGVQVTVRQEQYANMMRKTYARVDLARIAPPTAENPGTLVVTDIFEPQHVRENPPPVELTKDELEELARTGELAAATGEDPEEAITALLEGNAEEGLAKRLKFQRATYADQPARPVLEVLRPGKTSEDESKNRLVVLTGEPGSGKSTLLRYLLLGVLDPPPDPDDPTLAVEWTTDFTAGGYFPFLIELRDYHFTCDSEAEVNSLMDYARYLGETMGYGIDDHSLDERLRAGPSLILFDGLDEIFSPERRDHVMRQIVGFTETYPLARVIVTSRPHGYHEGILRPAGFAHYRLQDLDRSQKETFTRAWFSRVFPNAPNDQKQRVDRILSSVDRSASVRWLAGNPLLLTIMCLIARERELPEERAEFYEQCLDVLVHQWEVNNHLQIAELAFLSVYRKKDLLRHIAFEMQASEAGLRGNFIAEQDLLQLTQDWFEETYSDLEGRAAESAAQQMVKGLWQRNYVLCPRGPELYGFLHRTFMEFLTATELVRRFEKTDDFGIEDLEQVFREHGNEPEWSEVLRLICGEIGEEYAERLIRVLLTLKEIPTNLTNKNLPYHLLLGIRCLGELWGLSKMEGLGRFTLGKCLEFMACGAFWADSEPFIRGQLLEAIAEIGTRWPAKGWLLDQQPEFVVGRSLSCAFWPELLIYVVQDRKQAYHFCSVPMPPDAYPPLYSLSSFKAIAKLWPDDATREFLIQQSTKNESAATREVAVSSLVEHESWRDETLRNFLSQRAVQDEQPSPRSAALRALAAKESWRDETLRNLLSQRAVQDEQPSPRIAALKALAANNAWRDEALRNLLAQRVVQDDEPRTRIAALRALAANEAWRDETLRNFLIQRTYEDAFGVFQELWELLTRNEHWANHEETQAAWDQFAERFREDPNPEVRGEAACVWFGGNLNPSKPFARAKSYVFSRDIDGIAPYLDPWEPISDDHLTRVAKQAKLSGEQLETMVEQMNAVLGWDLRAGRPTENIETPET